MPESFQHPLTVVRRSASRQIAAAIAAGSTVLDVTSRGAQPWVQFSPFYPHRGIPVPMSAGYTTYSVEGAWQGLKVFETHGVDLSKLRVTGMKDLKRTVRKYGRVLGHRAGVSSPNCWAMSRHAGRSICRCTAGSLNIRSRRSSIRSARCWRIGQWCCWTTRPTLTCSILHRRCRMHS